MPRPSKRNADGEVDRWFFENSVEVWSPCPYLYGADEPEERSERPAWHRPCSGRRIMRRRRDAGFPYESLEPYDDGHEMR